MLLATVVLSAGRKPFFSDFSVNFLHFPPLNSNWYSIKAPCNHSSISLSNGILRAYDSASYVEKKKKSLPCPPSADQEHRDATICAINPSMSIRSGEEVQSAITSENTSGYARALSSCNKLVLNAHFKHMYLSSHLPYSLNFQHI